MMRALAFGLFAASASALHLKQQSAKPSVLRLRGGLAGVDAEQVAKVVQYISCANAGVMTLAPTKAGEMYGVTETKWTNFFAQWSGIIMLGQGITALLAGGGMDMAQALAWGFVPSCVVAVQDLLNDRMVGEMGMGMPAKFMPPLINLLLTAALFGKTSFLSPENAMKFCAVWMGANGLAGYFSTDMWIEGWGGSGLGAAEKAMGKLMGSTMVGSAAYIASTVFFGKSALEAFGVMMGLYALSSIDGLYISKTMESMGVDPPKVLFWAALQLGTAAAVFL
jgi:phage-related minor tail protein